MRIETAYQSYSEQMLKAMIRFSRDEAAANDAVSQAFTQALINRPLLESMPEPAVKAWLYAAAKNAVTDIKRKEARFVPMDEISPAEEVEPAPDPNNRILAESMLNGLPAELRIPVYLKYYRGCNSTEIGRVLGIPASTVRTRIRAALNQMRSNMKGDI